MYIEGGQVGGGEVGIGGGWEAEGRLNHLLAQRKSRCVFSKARTVYMSGQDVRWEQFDTTCSLISGP